MSFRPPSFKRSEQGYQDGGRDGTLPEPPHARAHVHGGGMQPQGPPPPPPPGMQPPRGFYKSSSVSQAFGDDVYVDPYATPGTQQDLQNFMGALLAGLLFCSCF